MGDCDLLAEAAAVASPVPLLGFAGCPCPCCCCCSGAGEASDCAPWAAGGWALPSVAGVAAGGAELWGAAVRFGGAVLLGSNPKLRIHNCKGVKAGKVWSASMAAWDYSKGLMTKVPASTHDCKREPMPSQHHIHRCRESLRGLMRNEQLTKSGTGEGLGGASMIGKKERCIQHCIRGYTL
eukprot:210955-Pelagomonas_calceolata.AAC.3